MTRMEYDERDKRNIKIVSKSAAYLYAFRPMQDTRFPELPYLSLYDFSAIGGLNLQRTSFQMKRLEIKRMLAITPGSRLQDVRK